MRQHYNWPCNSMLTDLLGYLFIVAVHVHTILILKTYIQCLYEYPPSQDDGIFTFYWQFYSLLIRCLYISFIQILIIRGRSRTTATSKIERFVIIVNGQKPLTIITKRSILDFVAVLDPPLTVISNFLQNLIPTTRDAVVELLFSVYCRNCETIRNLTCQ